MTVRFVNDNTHSVVIKRCVPADDGRVRDGGGEDKPHEVIEQLGKDGKLPGMKRAATLVQRVHLAHDPRCLQGICQAGSHEFTYQEGTLAGGLCGRAFCRSGTRVL